MSKWAGDNYVKGIEIPPTVKSVDIGPAIAAGYRFFIGVISEHGRHNPYWRSIVQQLYNQGARAIFARVEHDTTAYNGRFPDLGELGYDKYHSNDPLKDDPWKLLTTENGLRHKYVQILFVEVRRWSIEHPPNDSKVIVFEHWRYLVRRFFERVRDNMGSIPPGKIKLMIPMISEWLVRTYYPNFGDHLTVNEPFMYVDHGTLQEPTRMRSWNESLLEVLYPPDQILGFDNVLHDGPPPCFSKMKFYRWAHRTLLSENFRGEDGIIEGVSGVFYDGNEASLETLIGEPLIAVDPGEPPPAPEPPPDTPPGNGGGFDRAAAKQLLIGAKSIIEEVIDKL